MDVVSRFLLVGLGGAFFGVGDIFGLMTTPKSRKPPLALLYFEEPTLLNRTFSQQWLLVYALSFFHGAITLAPFHLLDDSNEVGLCPGLVADRVLVGLHLTSKLLVCGDKSCPRRNFCRPFFWKCN